MSGYKLTYFDIRGRAEISRLVFAAADVPYTDERVSRENWPALKAKTSQGQLPILTIDDATTLPQSLAIARFLAREFGLSGKTNLEHAQCDVIVQTTEDLRSEWVKVFREQDETKKAELQKKLIEEIVPKFWAIFQVTLTSNPSGYMVGDSVGVQSDVKITTSDLKLTDLSNSTFPKQKRALKLTKLIFLTIADLAVYDVMEIHTRDYPDLIKGFPALLTHRQKVADTPNIKKYLEKRAVTLY